MNQISNRQLVITAAVACALAGTMIYPFYRGKPQELWPSRSSAQKDVAATVDGKPIYRAEVSPLITQGMDPAVAVDKVIMMALAADSAEAQYSADSKVALQGVRRAVLANLYVQKKGEELVKSITDNDISTWYEKNVRADDYKMFKLKYYLTQDAADAQSVHDNALEHDARGKFAYMQTTGDHFMPITQVPYNMGSLIQQAKAGTLTQPVPVRNGLMLLLVEDVREGARPSLASSKQAVRTILAQQRLNDDMAIKRKTAHIELK